MKILVRAFAPGTPTDNVGDAIGPWIARTLGYEVQVVDPNDTAARAEPAYLLCGSILSRAAAHDLSFGCGIGSESDAVDITPHDCWWVRGPFSALHLTSRIRAGGRAYVRYPFLWGDTAMVLPLLLKGRRGGDPAGPIGLIPHYADFDSVAAYYATNPEVGRLIDPRQPVEAFVEQVTSCRSVYSGSLHGIVVAHAYGMQATWWGFGDGALGDGVKFRDHFQSWTAHRGSVRPIPPPVVDAKCLLDNLRRALP